MFVKKHFDFAFSEAVTKPEKQNVKQVTVVPTSRPTSTGRPKTAKNDDFIEYVNQPMVGRKWNEHEYYVKAKNDMRKHHHEKVAKVCVFVSSYQCVVLSVSLFSWLFLSLLVIHIQVIYSCAVYKTKTKFLGIVLVDCLCIYHLCLV